MKFNIDILRQYLLIDQGVLPEQVTPETEFINHLHMSCEDIRRMLVFITKKTGVTFSADSDYYLTDVFELLIHMMVRSVEVEISEECFAAVPDTNKSIVWQQFLHKKFQLPLYSVPLN